MLQKKHIWIFLAFGMYIALVAMTLDVRHFESRSEATSTFGIILPPPPPPPPAPSPAPAPAPSPAPSSGVGGGVFISGPGVTAGGGVDRLPPAPVYADRFVLSIESNARKTKKRNVLLTIDGETHAEKMEVSNFANFRDSKKEKFVRNKKWDLCSKSGGKIKIASCRFGRYGVYVKLYDKKGTLIDQLSDKIIYEGRTKKKQFGKESDFVMYNDNIGV